MTTVQDRERIAARLLASSARQSFGPLTKIDWDAPLAGDMFFSPPRRVSLYGTPLWDTMTRSQQIALSRHEAACVASVGIWFELILMRLLARYLYAACPSHALTFTGPKRRSGRPRTPRPAVIPRRPPRALSPGTCPPP